jgi:hypothetical protein
LQPSRRTTRAIQMRFMSKLSPATVWINDSEE